MQFILFSEGQLLFHICDTGFGEILFFGKSTCVFTQVVFCLILNLFGDKKQMLLNKNQRNLGRGQILFRGTVLSPVPCADS